MKKVLKKIVSFICALMLVVVGVGVFAGCKKNDDTIRVNEVTHSVFYAPFYAAIEKGYFKEEGLNIELTNGGGSNVSMNALISGSADVILAGPETAVYVAAGGAQESPVIFGQLTQKDGSFLVGKQPNDNFKLTDLIDKEVITGRPGGMPAMTFEYILKQAGLELSYNEKKAGTVTINTTVDFNNIVSAFENGNADYCTMFEPLASNYEAAGKGNVICSMGELSGLVPYTAFMTKQSYFNKNSEKLEKFLRAVKKGYNYLMSADLDEASSVLLKSFVGFKENEIRTSLLNYKNAGAWCSSPVLTETNYNRLLEVLKDAKTLDKDVAFNKVVNNSIANKIA